MESGFTKKAETALQNAAEAAFELGHGSVGSEHILIGLLRTEECIANAVLVNNGVEESKVVELIKELIVPEKNVGLKEPDSYTPRAARILENARKEAKRFKSGLIGTEHIFIGMLKEQDCVATRLLGTIGVKIQKATLILWSQWARTAITIKMRFLLTAKIKRARHLRLTSTAGI